MYYCETCQEKTGLKKVFFQTYCACDLCGQYAVVYDSGSYTGLLCVKEETLNECHRLSSLQTGAVRIQRRVRSRQETEYVQADVPVVRAQVDGPPCIVQARAISD